MKKVEIVIGANYGDEGKGLLTRHFVRNALYNHEHPIVVLHNGTAQRGHTVDYNPHSRRVYHHFGSGTGDGVPTYFADTFWVHPAQFRKEYADLVFSSIHPSVYCHPDARVITIFDMLVDHATMAWIALQNGEREYGTCGLGSWCAIESRGRDRVYPISAYLISDAHTQYLLEQTWNDCVAVLLARGVDATQLPDFREYFEPNSLKRKQLFTNFKRDLKIFFQHVTISTFENIYQLVDNIIFESGQGLGLDKDVDNDWHTTSNTGLVNPVAILGDRKDFSAEVCYVTRSYLTRHGIGPLEEAANKAEINADMIDKTNVPNNFQGSLRYGYLEDKAQAARIEKDWSLVQFDPRFKKEMAITHCNEFEDIYKKAKYFSNNPYSVIDRS